MDLRSAFWQIPLDQSSKEKTALCIPGRGLFQFNVLPFGLSNATQCQQRLMDAIFGPELEPNIFCYLDDLIIVSSTFEKHLELLYEVARRLQEANLTVNFEKCEFFRSSLKYLGYIVDRFGLKTDPVKVSAMVNFPQPKNTTEVKRFTGLCSWYRRFIPQFSTLMAPINELIKNRKKGQKIFWNPKAQKAFEDIKQALVSAPLLVSPDFSIPFIVQCDASDVGLGCVLLQIQDGEEKVIAYASRSLNKSERNYSVTEKECLACIFACEKFRPFIEGVSFTLISDHASLLWFLKLKNPTGRLARWSVRLSQFDFVLEHRKGKFNVIPDALSRAPAIVSDGEECQFFDKPSDDIFALNNTNTCISLDIKLDNVFYNKIRSQILHDPKSFPQWNVIDGYVDKLLPSKIQIDSNVSDWKLLVPKPQRRHIISSCHDDAKAAHLGYFKTYSRVSLTYYWSKMRRDINKCIKTCKVCSAQKAPNYKKFGLMGVKRKVRFPF